MSNNIDFLTVIMAEKQQQHGCELVSEDVKLYSVCGIPCCIVSTGVNTYVNTPYRQARTIAHMNIFSCMVNRYSYYG